MLLPTGSPSVRNRIGPVAPRGASFAWLGLVFCVVVMLFGETLRFPDWLEAVSPFDHLASYPAAAVDWPALAVVLLLAVGVSGAGVLAFGRRDVH